MSEHQPFELVTNYQPAGNQPQAIAKLVEGINKGFAIAGDQPQAIAKLVEGINKGFHDQLLLGVTGSGKTYTMANVIAQTQRPTIVMAHNKTLAAQLYGEFKAFFSNNAFAFFSVAFWANKVKLKQNIKSI